MDARILAAGGVTSVRPLEQFYRPSLDNMLSENKTNLFCIIIKLLLNLFKEAYESA